MGLVGLGALKKHTPLIFTYNSLQLSKGLFILRHNYVVLLHCTLLHVTALWCCIYFNLKFGDVAVTESNRYIGTAMQLRLVWMNLNTTTSNISYLWESSKILKKEITCLLIFHYSYGEWSKTCRYCEGRVTMAAPGSMLLCVTTHTATYVWKYTLQPCKISKPIPASYHRTPHH